MAAASNAVRPMLSERAIDQGADALGVGIIATCHALFPILLSFSVGRAIDRRGPVPYAVAGTLLFFGGCVLAVATNHPVYLYVAAAAIGFGQTLMLLAQQAAAAAAPAQQRDRAFGWLASGWALGVTIGPLPAGFAALPAVNPLGWSDAAGGLGVGALLCLAGLPSAFHLRGVASGSDGPSGRLALQVVRTGGMWQALLAGAIVLAASDLLAAFLPLWARERAHTVAVVGVLLSLRGVSTLLARISCDRIVAAVGRRAAMILSLAAAAAGLALLPVVDMYGAVAIMVLLGVGLGLAQPLTMSWVSLVAARGTSGAALGIRQTADRVAQATVPATLAVLAAGSGAAGVFWAGSGLLLGASATLVRAPMGET